MGKIQLPDDIESQPLQADALQQRRRRALRARLAHLALTALIIAAFWLCSTPSDEPAARPTLPAKHDWSHLFYTKQCPGIQPISSSEFTARRDKLGALLRGEKGNGWGAYVTEPGPNTLYYTNLTDTDWYLSERPWLVAISPGAAGQGARLSVLTPAFEKSRSQRLPFALTEKEYGKVEWVTWEEAEDPYGILVKHLDGLRAVAGATGGWRIELEEHVRTFVGTGLAVAGQAVDGDKPEVGFASLAVREQRMRKTAAELDIQRCVAKVTVQALREVRTKLHLGMTELDGERLIKDALTGAGLTQLSAIVLFGANAALPHASASATKRLEAGEFALFDVGGHLLGYDSDFTRTMLPDPAPGLAAGCHGAATAGSEPKREWPSARAEKIWKTVHAAQVAALEAEVNANTPSGVVSAASVDKAARDLITAAGYGPYFTHRLGHGIGLQVHEAPYLNSGNVGQPINSGVTHSNEPGAYIEKADDPEGLGIGVRLEDMVLKTEDGWELLSGSGLAVSPWEW